MVVSAGDCGEIRAGMSSAGGGIDSIREENRLLSHSSISPSVSFWKKVAPDCHEL